MHYIIIIYTHVNIYGVEPVQKYVYTHMHIHIHI